MGQKVWLLKQYYEQAEKTFLTSSTHRPSSQGWASGVLGFVGIYVVYGGEGVGGVCVTGLGSFLRSFYMLSAIVYLTSLEPSNFGNNSLIF